MSTAPGGTTAGSEQLYDALRALQAKEADGGGRRRAWPRPAAISPRSPADHIIAQKTSLVGSIGVLFQYPNFTDLLDNIGVKVEEIKSSPLKAAPNGLSRPVPEARAAIEFDHQGLLCLVQGHGEGPAAARRRGARSASPTAGCSPAARGSASSWSTSSATRRPRSPGSPRKRTSTPSCRCAITRWSRRFNDLSFLHVAAFRAARRWASARRRSGSDDWGGVQAIERLNLDGLLALWHPATTN